MVLLFDFDGTLFDFDKAVKSILSSIYARRNSIFNDDEYEKFTVIGRKIWETHATRLSHQEMNIMRFSALFHTDAQEGETLTNEYKNARLTTCALYGDTVSVCSQLSRKHRLIVATNGGYQIQKSLMDHCGLSRFFQHLITPEQAGCYKPDPQFIQYAVDLCHITDKDRIILFGDSENEDILCARRAGIKSCLVNRTGKACGQLSDYTVNKLDDIYAVIEEIDQ